MGLTSSTLHICFNSFMPTSSNPNLPQLHTPPHPLTTPPSLQHESSCMHIYVCIYIDIYTYMYIFIYIYVYA